MRFDEFRSKMREQHKAVFEAGDALSAIANEIFVDNPPERLPQVIRALAMSVVNTFGALLLLVQYGFGIDAAKLARTMFEASVNMAYLRKHPDQLDNFIDYYDVAAKRLYEDLKSVDETAAANLPRDDVQETLAKFDRIQDRYRDKRSWTPENLFKRAKDVGTTAQYLILYKTLSGFIHSDIRAICPKRGGEISVERAPSQLWVQESLDIGHHAVLSALNDYNETRDHAYDRQFIAVHAGYKKAWP